METAFLHLELLVHGAIDPFAGMGVPRIIARQAGDPLVHAALAVLDAGSSTLTAQLVRQARLFDLSAALTAALGVVVPPPAAQVLAPAFALIEAQLARSLSRSELAAACGLRPSRFHQLFLAATGNPPMAWVARRRLATAAALIAGTGLAMSDIAARTGFCDGFHLNKRFRAAYGKPPTVFRREALEA